MIKKLILNEGISNTLFMSLLEEIIQSKNEDEGTKILYREDGVDMSYQREKITWRQHEILFDLFNRIYG